MAEGNNLFELEIITPDRVFYQGEAFMVEFTAEDGDIGVYKNHIPLTTVIAPGILNIKEQQGEKQAALHAGFAQTKTGPRKQKSAPSGVCRARNQALI